MDLLTIGAARLGIGSGASILSSLSQVAKTGDYDDLKNKPTYIKSIVASGNELTIENGDSSIATVILPRDTDIIDKYIVGSNESVLTDRKGNKITARETIGEIATSTRSGLMSSDSYNKIRDNAANIANIMELLNNFQCQVEIQTYTGNGKFGELNPSSITFSFAPKAIVLLGSIDTAYTGVNNSHFFDTSTYLGVFHSDFTYADVHPQGSYSEDTKYYKWTMHNTFVGNLSLLTAEYTNSVWLSSVQLVLTQSEYANIAHSPIHNVQKSNDGKTFTWYVNRNGASSDIFSDDLLKSMQLSKNGMTSYFLAIG